jgi:uncharacterized protein (DUF1501 family)
MEAAGRGKMAFCAEVQRRIGLEYSASITALEQPGGRPPRSGAFPAWLIRARSCVPRVPPRRPPPPPNSFPAQAARLAHLIRQDPHIRLGFASLGGWDTHVNQGGQKGQLANRLRPLGDGLVALAKGLGKDWDETVVVVLSEFGRTVHENGNGGTDHGHGNIIWVVGGGVRGGRIYGDRPGLAAAQLYQGRDLAVTTDYRTALALVLERHLRLGDRQLTEIFPGLPSARSNLGQMLAT